MKTAILALPALLVISLAGCGDKEIGNKDFKAEKYSDGIAIIQYTGSETDVIVPENIGGKTVYTITGGAFANNQTIQSVTLPNPWTFTIGEGAFRNCTALTTVHLPGNLRLVDREAFQNCTSLTAIRFPENLQKIGERAFENCTSLISIEIPEPFDTGYDIDMDLWAFRNCTALEHVTLPQERLIISTFVFEGCDKLVYPTGHALLDQMMLLETVSKKSPKTFDDILWLRSNTGKRSEWNLMERFPLENYRLQRGSEALPGISAELGNDPQGKLLFLERHDWKGILEPGVVYVQFKYLDYLLEQLPAGMAEQYTINNMSEIEYIVLLSQWKGEAYTYIDNISGNTGNLYDSTLAAELYRIDGASGRFIKIGTFETARSKLDKSVITGFGAVYPVPVEPRIMGYFEYIKNLR
ncbi:MAG: leucine-rich repeat domain-containing protein [Treponema sp.]|nr:leucine-rich repeat domain-containing protein [Treponema sp.]